MNMNSVIPMLYWNYVGAVSIADVHACMRYTVHAWVILVYPCIRNYVKSIGYITR